MSRSLRVSKELVQKVKSALKRKGFPSQNAFATEVGLSRTTVTSFLNGRPVDFLNFVEMSEKLGLSWQNIIEIEEEAIAEIVKPRQDWRETPDVSEFYGRQKEIELLEQWILADSCRLVLLTGIVGIGKTALAAKLAKKIGSQFDCVIWRSLGLTPAFVDFLAGLLEFLCPERQGNLPETVGDRLSQLMEYLHSHRCLLILDGLDPILASGDANYSYQEEYKGYGELIKRAARETHQSCLLLTGQKKPAELASLEGEAVRSFPVKSLGQAAREILQKKGLADPEDWHNLITLYGGNPLALKLVSEIVLRVFGGRVAKFFDQGTDLGVVVPTVFKQLLSNRFRGLSELQKRIMCCLAVCRKPVSLAKIREGIKQENVRSSEITEAVYSLVGSLVERVSEGDEMRFTLQPLVMKYVLREHQERCDILASSDSPGKNLKLTT